MKKSLLIGLLCFSAGVAASFGQGVFRLDNNNSSGPDVTYGAEGIPTDGVNSAPAPAGSQLRAGWTMGFYYAVGNVTGSIAADPTHFADPSTLGGGLILATGANSTAPFFTSTFGDAGEAIAVLPFIVPGTSAAGGDIITLIAVAYNTASGSYANATWRGHSDGFILTTSSNTSVTPNKMGTFMPAGFSVVPVPEPSVFVLTGLSGLMLVLFRHRNKMRHRHRLP